MTAFEFAKFHGAGNDFIVFDDESVLDHLTDECIARLCHRRFGIGADGLIVLCSSTSHAFEMRFFNSDGSSSLCGNGCRCAVSQYARNMAERSLPVNLTFSWRDRVVRAVVHDVNDVEISFENQPLSSVKSMEKDCFFVDNGSPHFVRFVSQAFTDEEFIEYGRKQRHRYNCNVNVVCLNDADSLRVQTFERGVENITLACGTGAVAVALAAVVRQPVTNVTHHLKTIQADGGTLQVKFDTDNDIAVDVTLRGPAERAFTGKVDL